ncbi:hypothetical protein [Streptomyces sp. NPDC088847]|uniref:hypothetical protein n=1 Tax=Streptomyces sp. NPDC088847 TaxID=3365909 RepID=UPI0037F3F792
MTSGTLDNWVWGPYPVHVEPCQVRLAHPELQRLLDLEDHTRTSVWLPADDPRTETGAAPTSRDPPTHH